MGEITRSLMASEQGDRHAAEQLLPLVYAELRKLAAHKLAQEAPGQTLQATALVHEAYLRLVDQNQASLWDDRGHFFAAAAEAMRRILIDRARSKQRLKRGGGARRVDLEMAVAGSMSDDEELLFIDDLLDKLARDDADAAQLVKLRCFVGLSIEEAGRLMGISRSTAYEHWAYARAWLRCELDGETEQRPS